MSFCRDCLAEAAPQTRRCAACGSPRLLRHDEIDTLAIAHIGEQVQGDGHSVSLRIRQAR